MKFGLAIRAAKPKDIPALADILAESFHSRQGILGWAYPFLRMGIYEDLRNRIRSENKGYICLVAVVVKDEFAGEEMVVGTVEVSVRSLDFFSGAFLAMPPDSYEKLSVAENKWAMASPSTDYFEYVYLSNLAVSLDYRRRGVAEKLLSCCESTAVEWGFNRLYLHVLENNYPARRLYYKAGYRLQETEWTWFDLIFRQPQKLFLRKYLSSFLL